MSEFAVRAYDGWGNNIDHPNWGRAHSLLRRVTSKRLPQHSYERKWRIWRSITGIIGSMVVRF